MGVTSSGHCLIIQNMHLVMLNSQFCVFVFYPDWKIFHPCLRVDNVGHNLKPCFKFGHISILYIPNYCIMYTVNDIALIHVLNSWSWLLYVCYCVVLLYMLIEANSISRKWHPMRQWGCWAYSGDSLWLNSHLGRHDWLTPHHAIQAGCAFSLVDGDIMFPGMGDMCNLLYIEQSVRKCKTLIMVCNNTDAQSQLNVDNLCTAQQRSCFFFLF